MLVILSPAKTLDLSPLKVSAHSVPEFSSKAAALSRLLQKYSSEELQKLMNISPNLADENRLRFRQFKRAHTEENAKPAILTFSGDVYRSLEAGEFTEADLAFAQNHIRILSGMYGLLRPLDLIQPYRLEMGSRLHTSKGRNLYEFWDGQITRSLNKSIKDLGHSVLVNLASNEYSKAIDMKKIKIPVINIQFKEYRNGALTFLSFNAKKARGLMARYIVKNRLQNLEGLKAFNLEDYAWSKDGSNEGSLLFIR